MGIGIIQNKEIGAYLDEDPSKNGIESQRKCDIHEKLKDITGQIDQKTNRTWKKVIFLTAAALYEESTKHPMAMTAKSIIALALLGAIYPAIVGSVACLETFRVVAISDLESNDFDTASTAAQLFGNIGMAITYLYQLEEFVFTPIRLLFHQVYQEQVCKEIETAYNDIIAEHIASVTSQEVAFLETRKKHELSHFGGRVVQGKIDEIQQAIDFELKEKCSIVNIAKLMLRQVAKDTQNASCIDALRKVSWSVCVTGLWGISGAILSIGTWGCYKPFDLQSPTALGSSDSQQVEDAVANYANAGHGLEYLAVMGILGVMGVKSILRNQYREVMTQQITEVYASYLKEEITGVSNILYDQREERLWQYRK